MPLTRRSVLTLGLLPLLPRPVRAAGDLAEVVAAAPGASATLPDASVISLAPGVLLPAGSVLDTGPDGPVEVSLPDGTRLNAGRQTQVALQVVTHRGSGSLSVSGTVVIDRRTADPSTTMAVDSAEFQVLLADAQVFIESLRGSAVFVREGEAQVNAPFAQVLLAAGEGIDLPPTPAPAPAPAVVPDTDSALAEAPGGDLMEPLPAPAPAPSPAARRWSDDRVADAFASVGLSA